MSYARVETSVRTHHKFIEAGPAPSWLWLCGLLYCQDALTDGFVADATIDYLGVKNARRLVLHLERAKLWERVDGGWQIHDYLKHNKPATEIHRIRAERAEGGKFGGRKPSRPTLKVNHSEPTRLTIPDTFPVDVDDVAVVAASVVGLKEGGLGETQPLDIAWESFKAAYPSERRYFGNIANRLFIDAIQDGRATLARMLAALENHKASAQWQDPSKIPNPEKWLEREQWNATMQPPKAIGTNSRTAGNADAARQFLEKHLGKTNAAH